MRVVGLVTYWMAIVSIAASCDAFIPRSTTLSSRLNNGDSKSSWAVAAAEDPSWSSPSSVTNSDNAVGEKTVVPTGIVLHENLVLRDPTPEERGKGGVEAGQGGIKALDVLARIPRDLIVSTLDASDRAMEAASGARNLTWATDLTAATLVALHPTEEELAGSAAAKSKQEWIQSWRAGGWATDGSDLGPPEANFGSKDVIGSLLATGTDNDHNIYAKFRMPCHPVLLRASLGLGVLTGCTEDQAREALTARGFTYRSMRDALEPLVFESTERSKGSKREKRCWDVADTLSRVLSRSTTVELEAPSVNPDDDDDDDELVLAYAIVPVHERLEHSVSENSKLVSNGTDEILLVATRDINVGEAVTRNYSSSPKLLNDESEGALHLLLQFGLPPKAWPASPN
mmetsp:Transcript_7609/g.18972  ORF Transcript_7609/g.18972 Transcript_7609/m.18972 type:complete len:400 (+) Transcript_7609:110-1309(+)